MEILIGVLIPFVCTTLGAASVFLFKEKVSDVLTCCFMALAGGIMVAASLFSLLLPALEEAGKQSLPPYIPVCISFFLGGLFLLLIDRYVIYFRKVHSQTSDPKPIKKTTMLILAITIHNIPEGMAVGLLYGVATASQDPVLFAGALALAVGIGVQNIPEGAAVALPFKKEGIKNSRAFIYGMLSGAVEPLFAVIAILFVSAVGNMMPWLLAFAAGAMIYVVVEELIPEAHQDGAADLASTVFMIGFVIMMLLDVALG